MLRDNVEIGLNGALKWIMSWSRVDILTENCGFPFLQGGNSAFIAMVANGLFSKKANICYSNS